MAIQKYIFIIGIILMQSAKAQVGSGFKRNYHFLQSGNVVADKNFYLITAINQIPSVKNILATDERLKNKQQQKKTILKNHISDTCSWASSLLEAFKFTEKDSADITGILGDLYDKNTIAFDNIINQHLRSSGYYQRFITLTNKELLLQAWAQYFKGINYMIDQFGLGKKMRYPAIDSASYNVDSRYYRTALKDMFGYLGEGTDTMTVFFQPSLAVALQLMDLNDRDEPARFEPMALHDNKKAIEKIKQTNWHAYKYAAILIPGNGPELTTTPISPINKMHCAIAATRFKKGLAPIIIVSGGYCYPFRGPYCEAIEMKKYLIKQFAIPEENIIIEPHARHTTTNFRNANRLIIRYGIPVNQPSLFVSTKSQVDYVMAKAFDDRNTNELGYLPYKNKQRLSDHDIIFYPTATSLHMDPYDPLDLNPCHLFYFVQRLLIFFPISKTFLHCKN